MKLLSAFLVGLVALNGFSQTEKHRIQLNVPGAYEQLKTATRDYGSHQLAGGTFNNNGTTSYWIAKMSGNNLDWLKTAPAFAVWYPLDIAPTDIAEVNGAGDIVFVGRGLANGTYTAQVLKLSAAGTLLWSKELTTEPGTFTQGVYENNSLIVEDDGVIVTMAGSDHLQVTKIGNDGNIVYSKQLKVNGATGSDNPGHLFIKNGNDGYYAGFECDSFCGNCKT